jgi:hypothetical protein
MTRETISGTAEHCIAVSLVSRTALTRGWRRSRLAQTQGPLRSDERSTVNRTFTAAAAVAVLATPIATPAAATTTDPTLTTRTVGGSGTSGQAYVEPGFTLDNVTSASTYWTTTSVHWTGWNKQLPWSGHLGGTVR